MKYKIKSIFVSLLLSTGLTSLGQEKVTTYVNPFIGTGRLLPIGEKPAVTTITTKSLSVSATPV